MAFPHPGTAQYSTSNQSARIHQFLNRYGHRHPWHSLSRVCRSLFVAKRQNGSMSDTGRASFATGSSLCLIVGEARRHVWPHLGPATDAMVSPQAAAKQANRPSSLIPRPSHPLFRSNDCSNRSWPVIWAWHCPDVIGRFIPPSKTGQADRILPSQDCHVPPKSSELSLRFVHVTG